MFAIASASIGVATALIVAMDWIATPLNRNISTVTVRERLPSTLIHGSIGAVLATFCGLHVWLAAAAATVWYALVLLIAIRNWWVPYFAGGYPGEITPQIYAKEYGSNLQVLPPFGGHPVVPDLQHILIHGAIALASATSLGAVVAS